MNQDLTTLICLFHQPSEADSAMEDILRANVPEQSVTLIGRDASHPDALAKLSELGLPSRDLHHLLNGMEHGGVVVAVDSVSHLVEKVEAIFRAHAADPISEARLPDGGDAGRREELEGGDRRNGSADFSKREPQVIAFDRTGNVVLPALQEELQVGKRRIDGGGVRVFHRTVEVPVNKEVTLREESVRVDRRSVDRPLTVNETAQGEGEVIELTETREELVVTKAARVIEEVVVGREAAERVEHISETLRHTELQVEQIAPGGAAEPFVPGEPARSGVQRDEV